MCIELFFGLYVCVLFFSLMISTMTTSLTSSSLKTVEVWGLPSQATWATLTQVFSLKVAALKTNSSVVLKTPSNFIYNK